MVSAEEMGELLTFCIMLPGPEIIFYIIIALVLLEYLMSRFFDYLNSRNWSEELPLEVRDIYNPVEYKRSQNYLRVNTKFSALTETFSLVVLLFVLFLQGFAWLDNFVREYTDNEIVISLLFFGILGLASDLISTPFSIYKTFVIEEKFGFNKTSPGTYIKDKLKGWLLGIIIGGGLLAFIVWVYLSTGEYFWLIAWGAITLFSVFMSMFYSNLIVPLFNKQTPLEEGDLKESIRKFANTTGFRLSSIFVIDGSKRSTKANAYFTGLGNKKRIVLYDTLINEHENDEIVAVLAHEIGHYKKKHTTVGLVLSIIQTGFMLFLLSLFIKSPDLSMALGSEIPSFHLGLIAFVILYTPVSWILGLGGNLLSRKHEYAADNFAGINFNPESLKRALTRLSVKNLSNLRPHPAYVFVYYSHPTLLQRLHNLDRIKVDNPSLAPPQ
jgi:STE24 endopeptidase